ncbi:S-layer family protein [Ezakiella coagulans]|uniref:S-layer family protein n=1 Tax=Ezakiella coagulans TaxID=46507 RepID=A0A2U1E287_9FIRM|nr:S-layer homology domain-containing protein [Ezakiella coagulans]PVY94005.1 S-layer family protein [Ezakiella coagulans]
MFKLNKQKIMIALLLAILIASSGVVESAQIEFKDISSHWAKDIIVETASKGFINGYEDGSFKPDNMISVKEALAILGRYAMSNQELVNNQVADYQIEPNSKNWGYLEVNFAMDRMPMNIFAGSESSRAITREETAYIISNLFKGIEGTEKVQISDINNSKFQAEVQNLVAGGIISGFPDGSFKPELQITRAELTSLLFKIIRMDSPSSTNENESTIDLINNKGEYENNIDEQKTIEANKAQLNNEKFKYTNNFTELFNSGKIIDFDELRDEFMYLLNKEREANGVAPLTLGEHLRRGTETRAIELAENGYHRTGKNYDQSHKRLDGLRSFRTAFDYLPSYDRCKGCSLGENVLVYTYTPGNEKYSAQDPKYINDVKFIAKYLFDIWKGSEGHYRNMMSSSYNTTWLDVKVSGVIYNYGTEKKDYPLHTILAVQVFDSEK